jgi:hypothetical protein
MEIGTIMNRNRTLLVRRDKKYEAVREILEEKYSQDVWAAMRLFLLTTGLFQDEETGQQTYQSQLATCRKRAQRGIDPLLKDAQTELNQNGNLDVPQWILGKENDHNSFISSINKDISVCVGRYRLQPIEPLAKLLFDSIIANLTIVAYYEEMKANFLASLPRKKT